MNRRYKLVLATAALCLAGSVGAVAPTERAVADDGVGISLFFGVLAPYGEWVQVEPYGWAWAPEQVEVGWHPYTVGYWAWVEPYGWTWVSDEPWGWATYHYGRWAYVEDYGWVWLPGTTWGPAWVAFRYGGPWVGWAPLPPGPGWRFDAGFDVAGLNVVLSIGTYAWTFTTLRDFGEPDLYQRAYVGAYNPYLVQRTEWSTRYAVVDGGVANLGVDVAAVEKAHGAPIPRHRLREATTLEKGGVRVEGDAVVAYRPRVAAKLPDVAPPQWRGRGDTGPPSQAELDAWAAQRRAMLQALVERQRKTIETQDVTPPGHVAPNPGANADDVAQRRAAAFKVLEDERKRLEALIERQRRRRELEAQLSGPAPGHGDGSSGMGGGHGGGMGGGSGMH